MVYQTWIPFVHEIFVLGLSLFSLFSSINVLFYKFLYKKCIKLAPLLQVYFFYLWLWSFFSFFNNVYLVGFWTPEESSYNERLLYCFGLLSDTLLFLNSVMGIFLCAERCFVIAFPTKFTDSWRRKFGYLSAVILILIYGSALWQNKTVELIPAFKPTTCYYRGCLVGSTTAQNFAIQKLGFSILDIFAGCILFALIRFKITENSQRKNSMRLNFTALMIVLCSAIFDFCPSLFFRYVPMNLEKPLSYYIGPYLITLGSLGLTLCAGIYANAFKGVRNPNHVAPYS